MKLTRERGENCLSGLQIDRLVAAELGNDERDAVQRHLATCARCTARRGAIEAHRAAIDADASVPAFKATVRKPARQRWHWLYGFGAMVAAAATILLYVGVRGEDRGDGGTRTKGDDHLSFYVLRDGAVTPGARGEAMYPGDRVRFAITTHAPAYLVIVGVDATAQASVYFPANTSAAPIAAGVDQPLPDAIELDDVLGTERIVALFCTRAIEIAEARTAIAAGVEPPGCRGDALTWIKQRR